MSPQRGGWEAITPMLGNETPEDCDSWSWDEKSVGAVVAIALVLIVLGVI
jgi:hypothetical protein